MESISPHTSRTCVAVVITDLYINKLDAGLASIAKGDPYTSPAQHALHG